MSLYSHGVSLNLLENSGDFMCPGKWSHEKYVALDDGLNVTRIKREERG